MKKSIVFMVLSSLAVTALLFSGCKEQPPIVIENPIPPKEPSNHKIENYYYVQFEVGKNRDTSTYQVPDDSTSWENDTYFNYVHEERNEPIFDTTDMEELDDPDERIKIGWTYAPTTTMLKKRYHELLFPGEDGDIPDQEEIDMYDNDYFSISFPWSTKDTLAVWDIEDYLNNPSIKKGQIKWGRVGNNEYNDSLWNNDAREGVVISYVDTAGTEWSSDNWPTFQPFGYFVINQVEANYRDNGSYDIITGEFAVRLYNEYQEVKDFRSGSFRLRILGEFERGPEPE
ncbi:MAG: hypothetical protein WEC59_02330 [Salibacteraceae bacterium]